MWLILLIKAKVKKVKGWPRTILVREFLQRLSVNFSFLILFVRHFASHVLASLLWENVSPRNLFTSLHGFFFSPILSFQDYVNFPLWRKAFWPKRDENAGRKLGLQMFVFKSFDFMSEVEFPGTLFVLFQSPDINPYYIYTWIVGK